jgi:chemotaxis protein methyltransferase CheR
VTSTNSDGPIDESDELSHFLGELHTATGFDFRDYALASMRRRVASFMRAEGVERIAELRVRARTDRECMARFILSVTVHSTSMFRDPVFFRTLRESVIPILRSYPFIRIWHAGCSTGEEAYSLAILLEEEGISPRCRIYATDVSEAALARAKSGIFPLAAMREYTKSYLKTGGAQEFSKYYVAHDDHALFHPALAQNIVFAQHNLVTDGSFNSFQLVLCRNVMIYFNRDLQNRVHELLYSSLDSFGILALGDKESIRFTPREDSYEVLDQRAKLYRRVP